MSVPDHPDAWRFAAFKHLHLDVESLQQERDALLAELAACRTKNKDLHRRAQKAESAMLKLQLKPVDTWKSRERQQEASVRDRMMAAVGRERDREEKNSEC